MKNSKRFRQLSELLQQVSGTLNEAIENATASSEVEICNVTIRKDEALQIQQFINEIFSESENVDLSDVRIPIQLLMVDDVWRKIQSDINELKK